MPGEQCARRGRKGREWLAAGGAVNDERLVLRIVVAAQIDLEVVVASRVEDVVAGKRRNEEARNAGAVEIRPIGKGHEAVSECREIRCAGKFRLVRQRASVTGVVDIVVEFFQKKPRMNQPGRKIAHAVRGNQIALGRSISDSVDA